LNSNKDKALNTKEDKVLNAKEDKARFAEPRKPGSKGDLKEADTRAGRALAYALDIRRFEIELYWSCQGGHP